MAALNVQLCPRSHIAHIENGCYGGPLGKNYKYEETPFLSYILYPPPNLPPSSLPTAACKCMLGQVQTFFRYCCPKLFLSRPYLEIWDSDTAITRKYSSPSDVKPQCLEIGLASEVSLKGREASR